MNNRKYRHLLSGLTALIFLLAGNPSFAAVTTWTGSSPFTNGWSDSLNWDISVVPGPSDDVLFANTGQGTTNVQGAVNNVVDGNYTVLSYTNQTTSANGFHTSYINPGASLNISGAGGNAIFVGSGTSLASDTVTGRFVGPGTLTVSNATGAISITQFGSAADHPATLDLSGLTNVAADVGQVRIAFTTLTGEGNLMSSLLLAETNFIRTAAGTSKPAILVGSMNNGTTTKRGTQQLLLGRANVIQSDTISIGGTKMDGRMAFRTGVTGGLATFRGSAGGTDRVKLFVVGDERAGVNDYLAASTGTGNNGTFDSTSNVIDMLLTDLYVARSQTNSGGATVGTFAFDQGTIDADNVLLGAHMIPPVASGQSFNATGTLNVGGTGALIVNNHLVLGRKFGTAVPSGTLNITDNGLVNVKGNIISSNGVSTINFNGGTINMQPSGDGSPGDVTVGTLSGSGGAIINANNITNTTLFSPGTQTGGGSLSIAANNLVLPSTSTALYNIADVTTVGSGVNDYLSVTGNITLGGSILFVPLNTTLANGTYRLIDYTGARTGTFLFSNPTRYTATMDYPPNQVNVTVGGTSGSVRWNSASSAVWDLTTSNWFNTGTAAADRFFQLDSVLADDSGSATNLLLLSTQVFPSAVTVNSSVRSYFVGGAGRISGASGITKLGTSTLTITNTHDFVGPVIVKDGMLRVGAIGALGSQATPWYLTNSGTYDINGVALNGATKTLVLAGNGLSNTGAVINTAAQQTAALKHLTLANDGSVGSWANRWDFRGTGGAGAYDAQIDLANHTLTKVGPNAIYFVDATVTNVGNFDIQGGFVGFARCRVDGPGTITVRSNCTVSFESSSVGYSLKPITVYNGIIRNTANPFVLWSPVTNVSGLTLDVVTQPLTLTNIITGAGGVTKISASSATLLAVNDYSGPTTVSVGTLALGTNGSIANSPSITVATNALFDVSSVTGGFSLASGQTLAGSGVVTGNVSTVSGNQFAPGPGPGTLTIVGNLTENSSTNLIELSSDPTQIGLGINDLLQINGDLTLNGVNTFKILPLATLNNASPYTLAQYTGILTGNAANINATSDSRYNFTVVDPLTTPGSIQVNVSGSGASASLVWKGGSLGAPSTWNTKITSNWLNGASADAFYLGDSVLFDDTSLTNRVDFAGTVQPSAMVVNSSQNYTMFGAGGLTAGTFTNVGPGSLSFSNSAVNAFGVAATIEGGAVTMANTAGNTFGSSIFVNGGSFNLFNGGANTFSQPITVNGSATVTVANTAGNTLSGGVVANGGSLSFINSTINTFNQPLIVNGGAVSFANAGGDTFNAGGEINSGSVTFADVGANTFTGTLMVNGGSLIFNQPVDATFVGVLGDNGSGAGLIEKQGNNTLTINGGAGYNGSILISSGTYRANTANALGSAANGTTVANGATLDINGQALNGGDTVTISGFGVNGVGAINNSGAQQLNGIRSISLAADAAVGVTGNRYDIRGGTVDLNNFKLTKVGAGTVYITDASVNNAALVEIAAGTLAFARASVPNAGLLHVSNNIVDFNAYTVGNFDMPMLVNGGIIRLDANNTFPFNSAITNLAGGVTFDTSATANFNVSGHVTGPGRLIKTGTGVLGLLATDNSWSGSTTIDGGTIQIGSGGADGSLPDLPLTNNGALVFNTMNNLTYNSSITGSGSVQQLVGGSLLLTASNSYAGATTLSTTTANSPSGAALRISNGSALGTTTGNTAINGGTSGNGRLELVGGITVAEPFSLTGRNTGSAVMNEPHIVNISETNVLTGQINGATGGTQYNLRSDAGKLIVAGNFVPPNSVALRLLKLMGDAPGDYTGIISNSVDTLTVASVTKTNLGTWTLTSANVYGGDTTISEGVLALSSTGSISNSANIDVKAGATFNVASVAGGFVLNPAQTLKGNGTVVGNVTAAGTVAPGESIGALTFANNLVLSGTTRMEIDRNGGAPTNDVITANNLAFGGTLTITNIGAPLVSGDTFDLFNWTTRGGTFAATNLPALAGGLGWDLSNLAVNGTITVVTTVATNPTNLTFFASGGSLTISWPSDHTGWTLQGQTNPPGVGITTNWFPVPGSTSTNQVIIPFNPAQGSSFYRLIYP